MKTIFFSLILSSLFLMCTPVFAVDIKPIDLQIPIGNTATITPCSESGGEFTCDGLAKYMVVIYEYLIRAAAILAVLMLVWGGVQWLSAAGESKRVGEAQKIVTNALIGLVLALGSHTLLWTINPNLVDLGKLKLALIEKKELPPPPAAIITVGGGTCGRTAADMAVGKLVFEATIGTNTSGCDAICQSRINNASQSFERAEQKGTLCCCYFESTASAPGRANP